MMALVAASPPPSPRAATPNAGYVYDLVRHLGASDFTARTAQFLVVRPLEILLIAVAAWLVGRLGARVVRRFVANAAGRAAASRGIVAAGPRSGQRLETVGQTVASLWKVAVWVVAVLTMIGTAGIQLTPIVAGATVAGAAVAFGAQRIVLDVLSGFFLLIEDQFGVGDTVKVGDTEGVVDEFHLRVTRLRGPDGTVWYVPNGEIRVLGNQSFDKKQGA